ncbi:methyl-accepting chemotaxis protein [Phycobacter azelaicus]|uniref:methyl-accepting chemotaxis protein n=1 Tax=Phycobacter azelaicus TaxID=2668075 RepID=UPI001868A97C|nr:methyl-accepting chemotaxis protein [Phycobacter azelaicus]
MSLRMRIVVSLLVSSLVAIAIVTVPLFMGLGTVSDEGIKRELQQFEARVYSQIEGQQRLALTTAQTVASMPDVQRAVAEQDRETLDRLFAQNFKGLAAEAGIAQFQFHTPTAVSVFRVHKPEKFGDDLSGFRHSVVAANAEKAPVSGLERGRAGIGIRGISPIFFEGRHVGTVEIGLKFDSALIESLTEGSDSRIEVYLLPDSDISSFSANGSEIQRLTGNYDGPSLINAETLASFVGGEVIERENFEIDNAAYAGRPFEIRDFSGNLVAVGNALVPLESVNAITNTIRTTGFGAALVAMLLAGAMALVLGKWLCGLLNRISRRMISLSEGDLSIETSGLPTKGEIGDMVSSLGVFRDALMKQKELEEAQKANAKHQAEVVASLGSNLSVLAGGDLTVRIESAFPEDYEQLRSDFNKTVENLNATVAQVVDSAQSIRNGAAEISQSSDDLSHRTESQAATLEETAAALDELTASVKSAAEGARSVENIMEEAKQEAENSGVVVQSAVSAMTEIEQSSTHIAQIISVIDDIAFQTNLLALNAGVEAARAGEAGRGFAVVASEVRALAQRSSDAAMEIKTLISDSSRQVERGVDLVGKAGDALTNIVERVNHISKLVTDIAEGAVEQSTGLGEINTGVVQLDQVTQQNAAMVEEATAAGHMLNSDATKLAELVAHFKVSGSSGITQMSAPKPAASTPTAHGDDDWDFSDFNEAAPAATGTDGNAALDKWQDF